MIETLIGVLAFFQYYKNSNIVADSKNIYDEEDEKDGAVFEKYDKMKIKGNDKDVQLILSFIFGEGGGRVLRI